MAASRNRGRLVVLVAATLAQLTTGSISYAAGVFHVALLQTFHQDVVTVAWLGAVFSSMSMLTGFLASFIINLSDCRTCVVLGSCLCLLGFSVSSLVSDIRLLFLTFAFLAGTGQGMVMTSSVVVLGYYFPDKPSMATSVSFLGQALGIFIHPPLVQLLVEWLGLGGAFLLVGALTSHALPLGLLLTPTPLERRRRRLLFSGRSTREALASVLCGDWGTTLQVLTLPALWCHLISVFGFGVNCGIFYLFLPDFLSQMGVSGRTASLGLSLNGVGSILCRVLMALVVDHPSMPRPVLFLACNGLTGLLILLVQQLASSVAGQLLFSLAVGVYMGVVWVTAAPLTLLIVPLQQYASSTGLVLVSIGLGFLIGPTLGGEILSYSGSYYFVFLLGGLSALGASFFGMATYLFIQGNNSDSTACSSEVAKEDANSHEREKFIDCENAVLGVLPANAAFTLSSDDQEDKALASPSYSTSADAALPENAEVKREGMTDDEGEDRERCARPQEDAGMGVTTDA